MKNKIIIWPESKIKIIKLWPWAKSKGHFKGQIWEIGYYSKSSGLDIIWLCDNKKRRYSWTIDIDFLQKHFEIINVSKIRNLYWPPQNSQKKWIGINYEIIKRGRKKREALLQVPC